MKIILINAKCLVGAYHSLFTLCEIFIQEIIFVMCVYTHM